MGGVRKHHRFQRILRLETFGKREEQFSGKNRVDRVVGQGKTKGSMRREIQTKEVRKPREEEDRKDFAFWSLSIPRHGRPKEEGEAVEAEIFREKQGPMESVSKRHL